MGHKIVDAVMVGVGAVFIGYHFHSEWLAFGVTLVCFAVIDFRRYEK